MSQTDPILDLLLKGGFGTGVAYVALQVIRWLFRTYTRREDAQSEARSAATAAQETIRTQYEKVIEEVGQLRVDLNLANDKIDKLEGAIAVSNQTNADLTTERDQLHKDLATTNRKLTDAEAELKTLRLQVAEMRGQLIATEQMQIGVVDRIVKFMEDMAAAQKAANGNGESVKPLNAVQTETAPAADKPVVPEVPPIESE